LKQMLVFNAEVSRLKAAEANAKRHQAMRWGGLAKNRNNMNNNKKTTAESAADMKDEHHSAIEQRLKTCRTLRQKCVGLLAAVLERRGLQQMNVDNCLWSLDALKTVVKREGLGGSSSDPAINNSSSSSSGSAEAGADSEEKDMLTFDHSRCTDCAYGYSMAGDCISHLAALQKQALDANKRLQALVEIRERMNEVSDSMRASESAASPNTHSSFSNNIVVPSSNATDNRSGSDDQPS
jgi:hypothetical protein